MKSKRIRRMVGIRKGGVAVIAVQYEDGEVMQYIFDRRLWNKLGTGRKKCAAAGESAMKTIWNPLHYISDYGWTCIVSAAGLLLAAMVLAGWA